MLIYISLLRKTNSLQELRRIHSILIHRGHDQITVYANLLIDLYGTFGCIKEAETAFHKALTPNDTTNSNMIMAYAQNGHLQEAEQLFFPIKDKGPKCYIQMLKTYFLYGCTTKAWKLFHVTPKRNPHHWNLMVEGNALNGYIEMALVLLQRTPFNTLEMYTAIMSAYAKLGELTNVGVFFERIKYKELSTWNVMFTAYAQYGHIAQALELFRLMDLDGFMPDEESFGRVLDGCADAWALRDGKITIEESLAGSAAELFYKNSKALRSGIAMFGKCEYLEGAMQLFNMVHEREVELWNALLSTCADIGDQAGALVVFRMMHQDGGTKPDARTFVAVLTACCHAGDVQSAVDVFRALNAEYQASPPLVDHYMRLADQLSRSGDLESAEDLLTNMPFEPEPVAWLNLWNTRLNWELWITLTSP